MIRDDIAGRIRQAAAEVSFAALSVVRDPTTNRVVYNADVMAHFCDVVGFDRTPGSMDEAAMLLCAWYEEFRRTGGEANRTMEEVGTGASSGRLAQELDQT